MNWTTPLAVPGALEVQVADSEIALCGALLTPVAPCLCKTTCIPDIRRPPAGEPVVLTS